MKAAVFSDTHGNIQLMLEAIGRCRPDVVIHLGDHYSDSLGLESRFPGTAFYRVAGNCDLSCPGPLWDLVPLGPVKAFICHGHMYNVKSGRLDSLVYAAQEQGAKIAMFGHTHLPYHDDMGGVRLINPGSAGRGRAPSWALVEVFENGGIACRIESL